MPGGTVTDSDRRTISFLTPPRLYFVEPGKTYLLAASYRPLEEFFVVDRSWDLSTGIVEPNFVTRRSDFAGLATAQLIERLRRELPGAGR
ncbi:MAG: hypothetical protein ACK5AZ_00960 [Bryobacteraceae bacterium]